MNKRTNYFPAIAALALLCTACKISSNLAEIPMAEAECRRIITNPIELNYRFQYDNPSYREAADPVLEYFRGKYYLFASKSGGYWSSEDLCQWTYIPCKSIATIENYAPTILAHQDSLYFLASGEPRIFRTANPDEDCWEAVDTKFINETKQSFTDPAFFKDEDGKVYLYWGCSNADPIVGVEVDPQDGFRAKGKPVVLIEHNIDKYGWEVIGEHNDRNQNGWNEGPCMIKHKGKYYLHYASPGTEFRVYGDGVYVGDNPLGPFTYQESNPFSFKPGGFIGGAGHGHTFLDKYGNYWHVATMKISMRHMFERRLAIFPVYFSENMEMHAVTSWADYPFMVPDRKMDFENEQCALPWNLLSYKKTITASSALPGYGSENANDELVETWWSAASGKAGEWLQLDLKERMTVRAIQVNFADQDFSVKAPDSYVNYQYVIEASDNGTEWDIVYDQSANQKDLPHDLFVLPAAIESRYIRVVNKKNMNGKFSISDIRLFGNGNGKIPAKVKGISVVRNPHDRRIISLTWNPVPGAIGYIVRWGITQDGLHNSAMVYTNDYEARYYNRDSEYYFAVDAFNENGISEAAPGHAVSTFR